MKLNSERILHDQNGRIEISNSYETIYGLHFNFNFLNFILDIFSLGIIVNSIREKTLGIIFKEL